jgi:tellurite resistance protein TehA-like permease
MERLTVLVQRTLDGVAPAWYPSIMGTGILAIGWRATPLPLPDPLRAGLAAGFWLLALATLATLSLLSLIKIVRARFVTSGELGKMLPWGAPPMAAFTVAVGFLQIGPQLFPAALCVAAAWALFIAGVLGGSASALVLPLRIMTSETSTLDRIAGTWLLPVVPPIVASVPFALLIPFSPASLRPTMLVLGYASLGAGLFLAAIVTVLFFLRLLLHRIPAPPLVPATWIVLGPIGQSIAGFVALGSVAQTVWPELGTLLRGAALFYGVVAWGFGLYWICFASVVTFRLRSEGIPFTLGWWSFTFPVGVFTAGSVALYHLTGASIYAFAADALIALLAGAWLIVASRTARHALATGCNVRGRDVIVGLPAGP